MVQASDFVRNGRIQIGALGTVLVGSTILAYLQGVASVFLSLVDIPLGVLAGLGRLLGQYVSALFGFLPAVIRASFQGAIDAVLSSGPFGFLAALLIVLTSTYILAEVLSRVR